MNHNLNRCFEHKDMVIKMDIDIWRITHHMYSKLHILWLCSNIKVPFFSHATGFQKCTIKYICPSTRIRTYTGTFVLSIIQNTCVFICWIYLIYVRYRRHTWQNIFWLASVCILFILNDLTRLLLRNFIRDHAMSLGV